MGNEVNKKILELKNYNVSMLDDLNSLSQPINNYGIKFLTFRRVYDDGRLVHFANDKDWLLYSFDHQLWQSTSSLKRISKLNADEQFAHVWLPNAHLTDHVYDAMKRHNLWNGLTLYDKREDYVDLWAFATDQSNTEVMNLYVNELSVIKRFILYLHDKANSLFFPTSEFIANLAMFASFAAGYLIRPIGAIYFSHIGDRYGRKDAFMRTVLFMMFPTLIITFLPGYEYIGLAAPIILIKNYMTI